MVDMMTFIVSVISDVVSAMSSWYFVSGVSVLGFICAVIVISLIVRAFLH